MTTASSPSQSMARAMGGMRILSSVPMTVVLGGFMKTLGVSLSWAVILPPPSSMWSW